MTKRRFFEAEADAAQELHNQGYDHDETFMARYEWTKITETLPVFAAIRYSSNGYFIVQAF